MCVYLSIYLSIYLSLSLSIHIYICIYMYIYIYTHTSSFLKTRARPTEDGAHLEAQRPPEPRQLRRARDLLQRRPELIYPSLALFM